MTLKLIEDIEKDAERILTLEEALRPFAGHPVRDGSFSVCLVCRSGGVCKYETARRALYPDTERTD